MRRLRLAVPVVLAAGLAVAACGSSSSTDTGSSTSTGAGAGSSASTGTASSSSAASCAAGSATASGSTALQPLAQKASQDFAAACSGATVTISGGGSSKGLSDVASGAVDIGDSDVPVSNAKGVDPSTVTDHQVAIVVFAVVVNPKTNVTSLTTQQVQDIFSGKVTDWGQVGGAAGVHVALIERKPGSGTRLSFDKDIMAGTPESSSPSSTQDSTQLVVQGVGGQGAPDGAVSYVSAASVTGGVKAVSIDGANPTAADVTAGKYKFFSHEHMYTKGAGSPVAQAFIGFILSNQFQTTEVSQLGFLPLSTTTAQAAVDS